MKWRDGSKEGMSFTDAGIEYLRSQRLARLATVAI